MRQRLSAAIAATALGALALAGCASGPTSTDGLSGSLEFMTGTSVDSALFVAYEELTDEFEAANPGVDIELVPSSTDHEGEVKTRLASGNVPDLWMTHGWSLLRYAEFLAPLQDEEWADDLSPALEAAMVGEGGELYALPIDVDIAGILYNADVLAAAGWAVEDIIDWESFMEACADVQANGQTAIYTAGKDRWPTGLFIDWIAPGAFDETQLEAMSAGDFQSDAYRQALELVAEFRDAGFYNPDYSSATSDDISLALAQDQTAFSFLMNFVAVTAYQYNPEANVGFMPIPSLNGADPYLVGGEKNAIGIWKDTESPEAARAYLAFLAQPENLSQLAEASGSAAGLTTASSDLGGLQASYDQFVGSTTTVPYFDRVYMPNGAWDSIVSTTESVLTNQSSIDEALDKVESDFAQLYEG